MRTPKVEYSLREAGLRAALPRPKELLKLRSGASPN